MFVAGWVLVSVTVMAQNVLELDVKTLNDTINSQSLIMVNYFTPWCGYCKSIAPILTDAAKSIYSQHINAKIASIDMSISDNKELLALEEITGFPTLALYKNGKRIADYHGERNEKEIVEFLKIKSGPTAKRISKYDELLVTLGGLADESLFNSGILSIVLGLFHSINDLDNPEVMTNIEMNPDRGDNDSERSTNYIARQYLNLALSYDLSLFFISDSKELFEHFGVKDNCLVIFEGDQTKTSFSIHPLTIETADVPKLKRLLLLNAIPPIIPYTADVQPIIQLLPIKEHVLLFYDPTLRDVSNYFLNSIRSVAETLRDRLIFIQISKDEYNLLSFFNLKEADLPQMIIADMTDTDDFKKYSFSDYLWDQRQVKAIDSSSEPTINLYDLPSSVWSMNKITYKGSGPSELLSYSDAEIESFLKSYLIYSSPASSSLTAPKPQPTQTLRPLFKSLLSEDPTIVEGINTFAMKADSSFPVETITSKTFHEKVMSHPEVDCLLYIFTAWCGHCKSLEPVIAELTKVFADDENFKIFRIDGSKNEIDHPALRIRGFPTLYFFFAYDKMNPVEYDGDRTTEAMMGFITLYRRYLQEKPSIERGSGSEIDENMKEVNNNEIQTKNDLD